MTNTEEKIPGTQHVMYKPGDVPKGVNNHTDLIQAWSLEDEYYMLFDIVKHNANRANALIARRMLQGPEHHKEVWKIRSDWHRKLVEGVLERRDRDEMLAAVTLWYDQVHGLLNDAEKASQTNTEEKMPGTQHVMYKPGEIPKGVHNHTDFIQAWLREKEYYMLYDITKGAADDLEALLLKRMDCPDHHKAIWRKRLDWHHQQVAEVLERRDRDEMIAAVTMWEDQWVGLLQDMEKTHHE